MASRKLWRQSKLLSYFGFKQKNGVLLGHPTNLSFVRHAFLHTDQVNGEVRVVASLGMRCFSHSLHTACDPVPGCEEGMNKLKELKAKESDGIRINRVNDFTRCGHLKNFAPQYEKAASLLSSHDPRIVIAKAESNKAAATENKGQAGPASAEIKSTEDASCLITDKRISVVGVFPKFSGEEFENFMSLAEKLRSVYDFGHTLDAELLPRGNAVSGPTTRLLKSFDELFVDSQNFEVSGMEKFLDESSVIVFDKDRKNHPYVIKFFNSPNAKKNLLASMETVMNIMKEAELQEEKVELSKKEASLGGLDTLERVEDLGQMLQRAREADDMHAGEVYGKKSILATEMRELQCPLINEPVKVVVPDSLQDVAFASGKNEEILVPGITGLSQEILVPGIIRPSQEILVPGINGSSSAQIQALIPEAGSGARQFSTSRRRRKGFRYDCGPYPRYLDWRLMVDKNKVPNIYDQYNLPSCWACAVATALEWKHLIEKGVLLPLSIQQLIDSVPDKKKGTQVKKKVVWSVFDAFELVRQQGITSGKLYPLAYKKCIKKQLPPVLHIKGFDGWEEVCDNNYLRLMSLLQRGPAVVNIRADDAFMIDNRKGLLRVPCYATPDHSMVCVGYDFRAEPHWILQNSWGKGDGNRGYVYYAQRDYPKCDPFFQYLPLICWQPL